MTIRYESQSDVMKRAAKFFICDKCGEATWEGHVLIWEITARMIGDHKKKIMHFCEGCLPIELACFMEKAEIE